MRGRKKLYIIILIVLFIGIILIKRYYAPKNRLEKLDRDIASIKKDVQSLTESISDYYKDRGKELPEYVFLDPKITPEIKKLIEERLVFKHKLAEAFELKGDYYLYEEYLSDKEPAIVYDRLSKGKLVSSLRRKDPIAKGIIKKLVRSRELALDSYINATGALGDETSDMYEIIKSNNPLSINRIGIRKNWSKLSLALVLASKLGIRDKYSNSDLDNSFVKEYFYNRVKNSLHYKKGLVYYQLACLSDYDSSIVKEDQRAYLDESEKEFLIAIGVDYKPLKVTDKSKELFSSNDYKPSKATYDLAKLYVYRYENFNDYKENFYLEKALDLLKGRVDISRESVFGNRDIDSLFLLGRVYYLMGKLDDAIMIYKNRLMSILPSGSSSYNNAKENYKTIEDELRTSKR